MALNIGLVVALTACALSVPATAQQTETLTALENRVERLQGDLERFESVRAIAEGRRPPNLPRDEEAVYSFCTEFFKTKQVSDATFQAVKDTIGERGIVEIIGAAGQYQMVSLFMNVDGYPLELNQKPELMLIAHPLP